MRTSIVLILALWLLAFAALEFGHRKGSEDYSTGGPALLRPELHRLSEP